VFSSSQEGDFSWIGPLEVLGFFGGSDCGSGYNIPLGLTKTRPRFGL
jgi:hypothetical protein